MAEHGPTVLRVCRALLEPADAADAWSETFLAALRAYPRLRAGSDVRAWLVTIAHRKAIDHLRRAARRAADVLESPTEPATHDAAPGDDELHAALDELSPKQRGAVVYRYLADLSYPEIGRLLACSAVAARRNAADGIANLRERYARTRSRRRPNTRTSKGAKR